MDRKRFYPKEKVTNDELRAADDYREQDVWNNRVDDSIYGVIAGLVATLSGASSVAVTKGIAIDQLGRRVKAYSDGASTKTQSYTTDTAGGATVVTGGNERWISIYANVGRLALDSRIDGNGDTQYFDQPQNLHDGTVGVLSTAGLGGAGVDKFKIVAGTSAPTGTATRPALLTDAILLCDILRTPSDASNVLSTTRRQIFAIADTTAPGTGNGLSVLMSAMTTWLGGRTNPAQASLHAAIDKIITDLAATTASDDGAERIGAQTSGTLSSGSVRSQLDQLDSLKAALAAASNHFTGNQIVDGTGSFGALLTALAGLSVTGTTTLTGNQTVSGTGSFGDKVRITPTQNTAAFDSADITSAQRLLLMEFNYSVSAGFSATNVKVRLYLNNKAIFTNGPQRSFLVTTNAKWDGTNWVPDALATGSTDGESTAVEIGGMRATTATGGVVLYRHKSDSTSFNDAAWTTTVDLGYLYGAPSGGGEHSIEGANDSGTANSSTGTNRFDLSKGQLVLGISGLAKIYLIGERSYAGAAFTAGGVLNFPFPYSSAPATVTFPTVNAVHTNCAAPTLVGTAARGLEWSTAVTGAGEYRLFNYVSVSL